MPPSPYRTSRAASPERDAFPLTPRSSSESLPAEPSHPGSPSPPSTPSPGPEPRPSAKLVRLASDYDDSDSDDEPTPRLTLFDASWSEDPSTEAEASSREQQRERRRRNRRIYGGGRHRHSIGANEDADEDEDDGGGGNEDMTVGEVAGLIVAGTLSPLPLLVPYACAALTPALFVPLLALSGILAWSSAVALGVQGRYVGARSYPGLASAVFPHRFKLHLAGEFLASAFVLGGSLVRTTLGVVAASEVVVDLVVPERRRRDWERTVAVVQLLRNQVSQLVVPLVMPPLLRALGLSGPNFSLNPAHHHYSRLASQSSPSLQHLPLSNVSTTSPNLRPAESRRKPHWTALLLLPSYFFAFVSWPLALLILGIRLKRLNRDHVTSRTLEPLASIPFLAPTDGSGVSLWPSILLTLSALSSTSHESFYYITSLIRPDPTASRNTPATSRRGSAFISVQDLDDPASNENEVGPNGITNVGGRKKIGKRNTFPLAMAIGIAVSFLVQLGWALVGTLGFASVREGDEWVHVGPSGNLLSDPRLPRGDGWLGCVRVLVLIGILGQLEGHARVGIKRVRRGVKYFFPSRSPRTPVAVDGPDSDSTRDETIPDSGPTRSERLRSPLSRSLIFFIVSILSLTIVSLPAPHRERFPEPDNGRGKREVGGHGIGLMYLAEWAGVGLSGLGCCLIPALTYLILFHLLPPRSILTTSSTTDPLLLAKERQIQRRLGGRRLWTDVAVFGGLGPVGVVVVVRGIWALI
ncbi:uncharacterized protein JCM15063_000278 [Sporobolomyces koalae]|uniref:uncharacterized protein n=1 Tax=Sporobolomyces koalae TaxID=500713 RepID=UPI00317D62BA